MDSVLDFSGNDFLIGLEDVPDMALEDLLACGGSGSMDENVAHFVRRYRVVGNIDDCRAYLHGFGAWEDDELQNHNSNLERLVWLTACALLEDGEAYFNTYA